MNSPPPPKPTATSTIHPYIPIVLNPDGTATRVPVGRLPTIAADHTSPSSAVLTKDLPLNPHHNTWIRLFLPRKQLLPAAPATKLPLVVYYHGGGFVTGSAASKADYHFCSQMALQVGVVVVSVDYRLAPEHRLPAAYDDAMEALDWVRTTDEEWLRNFALLDCCFLMGSSAGGNIAYHAGLRAAARIGDMTPLKIRGLVLHHPFFGGNERTMSELMYIKDHFLPLSINDLQWKLSLPVDADRDHEYSNAAAAAAAAAAPSSLDLVKKLGWRVMVSGGELDPLIDRQKELVEILDKKGVKVVPKFGKGDLHCVEFMDPTKAKNFFVILRFFVNCCVSLSKL